MTSGGVMTGQIPFLELAPMTREVQGAVEQGWARVLSTGRFIGGDEVARFEAAWAGYCQVPHALGVANGTDALQLALTGLGIGPGDEVIVPANTFVATAEAVLLAGAVPRFADVSPQTLLLTPECLEAALTPRTAAVIVVHLYGRMPDMGALCAAADRAGVALIEDAAQAHGATWQGRRAGSSGVAGCFSFYPGKNLGAFGDAGAVVTTDAGLAGRIRVLRDHGRAVGSHYRHELAGTNSRLDALQAVVLTAKLARLETWNAAAAIHRRPVSRRAGGHPSRAGGAGPGNLGRPPSRRGARARPGAGVRGPCGDGRADAGALSDSLPSPGALPALRRPAAAGVRALRRRGAVPADVPAHDR